MKINRQYRSFARLLALVGGCVEPQSGKTDATGETASQASVSEHYVNGDSHDQAVKPSCDQAQGAVPCRICPNWS